MKSSIISLAALFGSAVADLSQYSIYEGIQEIDGQSVEVSFVNTQIVEFEIGSPIEVSWATSQVLDSEHTQLWMSLTMLDVEQRWASTKWNWIVAVGNEIRDEVACTFDFKTDSNFEAAAVDLWESTEDEESHVTFHDSYTINNGSHSSTASCLISRLVDTGDNSQDDVLEFGENTLFVRYAWYKNSNLQDTETNAFTGELIELNYCEDTCRNTANSDLDEHTNISGAELLSLGAVSLATVAAVVF